MAEEGEPRRSGRATKGQYTKDRDINEEAATKRKGKGKGVKSKAAEEPEQEADEIIRCICGQYEEETDEPRDMVCCDNCLAWQHTDCMGLPFTSANAPEFYYCEQCRPEDHQKLLDAIARGEKPWEQIARKYEEARAAKKKKGGKRGRKSGGRPSEVQSEMSQEKEASRTPEKTSPAPATSGQKRKSEDAGLIQAETKKARSISVKALSPVEPKSSSLRRMSLSEPNQASPDVKSADDFANAHRKNAAKALIKLFTEQAKAAQKDGSFTTSPGQDLVEAGTTLALNVEQAMYSSLCGGTGDPNDAYKIQLRAIMHNMKSNPALRDRLWDGELKPHALAVMSAENMASKEQQQRDAAIKKEAEKQHMIVHETGPKIRRTHKGEEFVDEAQAVAAESAYSSTTPGRDSQINDDVNEAKSPTQQTQAQAEKHLFSPISRRERPSMLNTQIRRPSGATDRRSSSNINIQDVWSSVGSPDQEHPQFPPVSHRPTLQSQGPGAQADAEIDELLKDEDNESEPYSPKDTSQDWESVWKGTLDMDPIAGFRGSAKFTAGAAAEGLGLTWNSLLPQKISINGRIDTKRADQYLCGLRYSNTTDVIVVSVKAPENDPDRQQFDTLFNYFKERDRYGVVAKHNVSAVKDTYIMPVDAGATNDQKPEFLQLLDNDNIPNPNPEKLLLIVFVIRFSELPQTPASIQGTPRDVGPISASPIAPNVPGTGPHPHQGFAVQPTPYQFSPTPPSSFPPPNGNGASINGPYSPPSNPNSQLKQMTSSAIAAQQVLSPDLLNSPAIQQLIETAPTIGMAEMSVVKDCIQENPAAASNLSILTSMIVAKQNGGAPQLQA